MKNLLVRAGLTCALAFSFVPITTGLAQVKVGGYSNIQSARAWGKWWEHPFHSLGPYKYNQHDGNVKCWEKFAEMRGQVQDVPVNADRQNQGFGYTFKVVRAWNGKIITHADHIWYHRRDGLCIANQDHFYW